MGKYSIYKGVTKVNKKSTNCMVWQAICTMPNGKKWHKTCKTEKDAALAYDMKMIELGKEPLNILVKK